MAIGRLTRIGLTGFNWRMRWKNESENRHSQDHQKGHQALARRDVFVEEYCTLNGIITAVKQGTRFFFRRLA